MRQLILLLGLIFATTTAIADAQLERRIYYFSRMTDLFKNVCFDPDGRFREHVVISERNGSIRDSAIDCDAQALALDAEKKAIEAAVAAGGADCDVQITDPQLAAFASGITDIAEQVSCPGNGGALQCVEGIACNLASSMVPRFTRNVANFITGRSQNSSCGADGGSNCIENLLAGAVFNVKDTGCGIASLFGYNCDSEENDNSEQASSDAAVIASFQSNESVASFSEAPLEWMKQTAKSLFKQMGESIMERFGCAQWENPNLPFASKCLRPLSWSCADCSAKANMVCGVLGYIGGEVLVSFFTGAAVGIVARAASRIAIEAAVHFPRTTGVVVRAGGKAVDTVANVAAVAGRWAGRGGASIRNVWEGISSTRAVQAVGAVATRVGSTAVRGGRAAAGYIVSANDFARRRFFYFAASEDLAVNSVKQFNRLTQEAFLSGYRFAGQARSSTINNYLGLYPRAEDIRSGAYAGQGIRNERDYERFVESKMSPAERANFSVAVTRDGADSRVVLIDNRTGNSAGVGQAYDLTGRRPASASGVPITAPRRPEVIVRPPPEIVEVDPIIVTGSRLNTSDYPVIAASTRSESDLIRAFGGDNSYNRALATVARDEFRLPNHFEGAAYDLHEAWKAANPQLRSTRPQMFVEFDELSNADRLRYADELERAFREGNPALVTSRGFTEFRASLSGTPVAPPAGAVSASGVPITARTAERSEGIVVSSGRAEARAGSIIDGGRPSGVSSSVGPRTDLDPSRVTDITTGRTTIRTSTEGEAALSRVIGEHASYQDREIVLDILLGGQRRDQYFNGRYAKPEAFQNRYLELERQVNARADVADLRRDVAALTAERIAVGNEKTLEELNDLNRSRVNHTPRDIDCRAFANVAPGAFPAEGKCKGIKFGEDVNGRYCSCGAMNKTRFTWLVRCPTSTSDFSSLATYVDELALPYDSAPDQCTRVDIPRGKECYLGPTSATFAGFGGTTQLLCEDRAPVEGKANYQAATDDVARFGLDIGGQAVRPVRWSPFSTFPEYQRIIDRASRACTNVCDINELRLIDEEFARSTAAIRARGNPRDLERLAIEERDFARYMRELREGRRTYPDSEVLSASVAPARRSGDDISLVASRRSEAVPGSTIQSGVADVRVPASRAPEITLQVAGGLNNEQRIAAAERIIGNVSGSETRSAALIRAHEVAPGRGYGTYSATDLREKRSILLYGKSTEELAAYRRANGNSYPPQIFTEAEADAALRRGLAGNNFSAVDDFSEARSNAVRARDMRGRLRDGNGDIDSVREQFRTAAQGYEREARRARSPDIIGESWRLYARAGDKDAAFSMIDFGVRERGMTSSGIITGLDNELTRVNEAIRTRSNPALILERDTLMALKERVAQRAQAARAASAPPVAPRATPQPAPVVAQPVTPTPTPIPAPVQAAPVVRAPAAVDVTRVTPRQAQDIANDYRLGRGGKTQDSVRASQYYYRASEGVVQREMVSLRRNSETNFMADRNFSSAFEESLRSDGVIAVRALDDIFRAGGETRGGSAINAFLAENFQRFNTRNPSPAARANIRKMIKHVQENYQGQLYDQQRNYMRSWSSANFDD